MTRLFWLSSDFQDLPFPFWPISKDPIFHHRGPRLGPRVASLFEQCFGARPVKLASFGCIAPLWCVLGKNSSLGARKDWRIVFFLWVFTWCVRGFWLPQGYVEKIVWAWNGTPVTLVLRIKHLCGGFLCERNSSLGKWGDQ